MDVKNKVCIITGSAQGLGMAFAVRLLNSGARVCISDIKEDGGKAILAVLRGRFGEDKVVYVSCDVTQEDQLVTLFDEAEKFFNVGCVDLLVNNAGINTNLGWRKCMEVNILGVMAGTDIAWRRMKAATNHGTIVNIASMAGILTGWNEDIKAYFVSKHGVVTLSRTLHTEFQRTGVSVKCLCPTWADTEIVSSVKGEENKAVVESLVKATGLMTVEHVAEGFYKLVTECDSGAVMAVAKGVPFFLIPDTSSSVVKVLAITAKLVGQARGMELVKGKDLAMGLLVMIFLLIMLIAWIF